MCSVLFVRDLSCIQFVLQVCWPIERLVLCISLLSLWEGGQEGGGKVEPRLPLHSTTHSFFFPLWYIFNLFIFNWRIIALQYYIGFCHTATWIRHTYSYVPSLLNLPPTSHPIPLNLLFFIVSNFGILNSVFMLKSDFIWKFVKNKFLKRLCHTFGLQIMFRLFVAFFLYFMIHFKATW